MHKLLNRAGVPWLVGSGVAVVFVIVLIVVLSTGGGSDDELEATGTSTTGSATTTAAVTTTTVATPDSTTPPSTDAPTTTTSAVADPTGGDDEFENPNLVGIHFGAITQQGVGSPSPPPEPIPQMPEWEMIELDTVESPEPEAFVDPDPVTVPALSGPIDDFVSSAVGCQLNCIRKAQINPSFLHAEVDIEVETNVPTTLTVWMSTGSIITVNNVPFFIGVSPIAWTNTLTMDWEAELGPLQFDTTYNIILRATDGFGNSKYATTAYTTVGEPTPGQLVGNGGGCYYQCIVDGEVLPTEDYGTVLLVVRTTVVADFDIAVSKQEPGTIGGDPFLPKDETFVVEQDSGTAIGGSITGLDPSTTYHVVVKATDNNGFTAHATGEFRTADIPRVPPQPRNIFIRFERITIIEDGDPGPNRGEIELQWGLEDRSYLSIRNWDLISSGTTIVLPEGTGTWVTVEPEGSVPNIVVNSIETDWTAKICPLGVGEPLQTEYFDDDDCGLRRAVAQTGELPLSFINNLPGCSSYFTVVFGQDRPCIQFESQNLGNTWVWFRVIVSFNEEAG